MFNYWELFSWNAVKEELLRISSFALMIFYWYPLAIAHLVLSSEIYFHFIESERHTIPFFFPLLNIVAIFLYTIGIFKPLWIRRTLFGVVFVLNVQVHMLIKCFLTQVQLFFFTSLFSLLFLHVVLCYAEPYIILKCLIEQTK